MVSTSNAPSLEPEDLLTTHNLYRRRARPAPLESELKAYQELSVIMASDPVAAINRFLALALELCPAAGSAGLSELDEEDGEGVFGGPRWRARSHRL